MPCGASQASFLPSLCTGIRRLLMGWVSLPWMSKTLIIYCKRMPFNNL
jgi:hypothetical protein